MRSDHSAGQRAINSPMMMLWHSLELPSVIGRASACSYNSARVALRMTAVALVERGGH